VRRPAGKTLVFIGAEPDIPPTLREDFLLLDHGLPDREEIRDWLVTKQEKDIFLRELLPEEQSLAHLTVAAQGLDLLDIERALRLARVTRGAGLDEVVGSLHQNKKQILRKSGIMEFVENDIRPEQVGGMENLKAWMEKRERAFGAAGFAEGRNLPRGVLMMGISGCGKSLFVKAIAARWRLPLIRLDMATVYEGTFGSPEASLRKACKTAEALAPCVLCIDVMESGISTQGFKAEGGPASRVLGYFLTWMQERRNPVFVAATANAIEMLPAEVLRKGRFDEIFYIDLPAAPERRDIFKIHLIKRARDPRNFELEALADATEGFSGAEIEECVISGLFDAFNADQDLTTEILLNIARHAVPLSRTMQEEISELRQWADGRARSATSPECLATPERRRLEI
jgi:vesicle-fusing ATPase